jgi:hypothetical protein
VAGKDLASAEVALVGQHMQIIPSEGILCGYRHRAQLIAVMSLVGHLVCHDQRGLGIDRALPVVADHPAVAGTGRHGAGVGIGQGYLAVRRVRQGLVHRLQPADLLPDAPIAAGQGLHLLAPRLALFLPVDADHLGDVALDIGLEMGQAAGDLALGEVAVAVVDGLELGSPSMATQSPFSVPIRRQSSTNCTQVLRIPGPLSRRKSAMVLWSGTRRPVSHIASTFRPASRSSCRLDGTRFR